MGALPLHPAIVHIPLGLAVALPFLAIGLGVAVWRGWLPARAWSAVVLLQALLVGAGFLALKTGEGEEERVESVVQESAIEAHEEAAEGFMVGAGITLALAAAVLFLKNERLRRIGTVATAAGTLAVLGLGVSVGRAGGSLVYERGAANAYVSAAGQQAPPTGEGGRLAGSPDDDD
jgi:uncharacterized membrane protein